MYDVVVVGAGPAGSRFARSAAERGRDVLVLESGEIGRPLACSGHVSLDVWDFVPESAREDLLQNEIHGARFHLGGADSPAHPFYKDGVISNVIDRVGLDRTLAECARDAGAEIRTSHRVTAVRECSDRVEVDASGPDGLDTFEARLVCGADGPRSKVRNEVGLPEPEELLHGVLGFSEAVDDDDFVDVHLTIPRFFAWRIPRRAAGVEYGLAADIAAREIDPAHPASLHEYEHAWRSALGGDQALGAALRAGYSLPRPIQQAGMRALSGEIGVHMDRPSSLFSRAQLRALLSWN